MILEPSRTIEIQYDQYNRQWQVQLYIDDKYISLTRHSDQCTAFSHAQCDAWEIEELHGQKPIIKIFERSGMETSFTIPKTWKKTATELFIQRKQTKEKLDDTVLNFLKEK